MESTPPMAFQPPLNADDLSDFMPPQAVVITVTIDLPGGLITPTQPISLPLPTLTVPLSPTIPLSVDLASIAITRPVTMNELASQPLLPALPPLPLPTVTMLPQPTGSPTVIVTAPPQPTGVPTVIVTVPPQPTVVPTVTVTVPPQPTVIPTVTPPISQPVTIPINGLITNVVSFDQGQLAVVIEDDTVAANSQLRFTALPVPDYPLTATNTISDPAGTLDLIHFQLEMVQNGVAVDNFEKPVRLVLDMRSLTGNLNPVYEGNFFLAYADENEPGLWHEVPITVHQDSGLISAEVTHFSTWKGGSNPERWNPSFVPATVSEFSGAATYNYPIEVPPGRNGLQPAVSLSYNSRALDGAIQDIEAGDIANGWSLAQIAIVRQGVKVEGWGVIIIFTTLMCSALS